MRIVGVLLLVLSLATACGSEERRTLPSLAIDPWTFTQVMVDRAMAMYAADGYDTAVTYYNDPASMEGSRYVFILRDGVIVAYAARPERLGLTVDDLIDVRGYHYGAEFAAVPHGFGRWVDYTFRNPTTGREALKHSWVAQVDGLLFGSEWYESKPTLQVSPGRLTAAGHEVR